MDSGFRLERFDSKTERQGECLVWTRAVDKAGYGHFHFDGKNQLAHRMAWFLHYGEWPKQELDHLCRNKRCVDVNHLEDVAPIVNKKRTTGHGWLSHCRRGHPYNEENTYVKPKTGKRECRACHAIAEKKRYHADA